MSDNDRQVSPILEERLIRAQVAVLGCMLVDETKVGSCLQALSNEDFVTGTYKPIFRAIRKMFSQGDPIDPIVVNERLGGGYNKILAEIVDLTVTTTNCELYVDLLRADARIYRRQALAYDLSLETDAEASDALLEKINADSCDKPRVRITSLEDCYQEFLDRHEDGKRPAYFTWGIQELDDRIYIEPGDFVVLGGYPSSGKTAMALQMAHHIAEKKRVGYFYLENNDKKLFDRLVSSKSMVPFSKIKRYDLDEADFSAIAAVQQRLISPSLHFVDAAGMSVSDIRAVALSLHFDLVIVDYLQKLRSSMRRKPMSDFERVSEISSDLQTLGRQTGMTILALSQLSRPDKRNGKTPAPGMHSFRQSGQIEQDADVALLLYREDDSMFASPRILKIGKNKEGVASVALRMFFDGDTQTFRRVSAREDPPEKKRRAPRQVSFWEGWTEVTDDEDNPFQGGDTKE